jgi:hypothetical protein
MGEGVDLRKVPAEEWEANQEAAQQIRQDEGDASHPQVVEQRDRTEKL